MAKKNFYAVKAGRVPGIYKTWDECSAQVTGFAGAHYRGFNSLSDAEKFRRDNDDLDANAFPLIDEPTGLKKVFIYTDGTSIGDPGVGGYAAILIQGNIGRHRTIENKMRGDGVFGFKIFGGKPRARLGAELARNWLAKKRWRADREY